MANLQIFQKQSSGHLRGFTRMDLCAVIAAATIMVGLALPGLAVSNHGTSRAVCFSNLKQMGIAMSMYVGDNRDYLAYCNWDGGVATSPGWLYNGSVATLNPASVLSRNDPAAAWESGVLFKYINDPSAYRCPVDIQLSNYPQRINKLSSYVMDGAPTGYGSGFVHATCKLTQVWSPNCYLLWEPDTAVSGAFEFNDGANSPGPGENLAPLHTPNGSEVLCVSGNVDFVTTNSFAAASLAPAGTGSGPGGKNFLWWSPLSSNGH
jgi:hypothetical protein